MGQVNVCVSLAAGGQSQLIEGNVCISASEIHTSHLLSPIISKPHESETGITINIFSSYAASNFHRRQADIAIRSFRPTQQELITKKIKDVDAPLYTAKSYLKRVGVPKTHDYLRKAEFVTTRSSLFRAKKNPAEAGFLTSKTD